MSETERVTYRRLLVFFLPLAATPFMIASTHTIANSVMARLPYPVLSLAVFAVVQAMTNTIKAPDILAKEVTVSLVDGRQSLQVVSRFVTAMALVITSILMTLAYTPLGEWVFYHIMGLQDAESIAFAYSAMRIACFLPLVEVLRNFFQGLAIGVRKTGIISFGTAFRLVVISLISLWAVHTQAFPGVVIGAFIWTAGIGMEGLFLAASFLHRFRSPAKAVQLFPRRNEGKLTVRQTFLFFLPLAAMIIMNTSLQPFIQGIIARSPIQPTESLAAYGVAWGLFLILAGPLNMLHQCSLVFATQAYGRDYERVRRFCFAVGVVISVGLAVVSISPLGYWIMIRAIGVSTDIAALARWVLLSFTLYPVLRAWQELHWGLLMGARRTSVISFGKVLNLATALGLLLLFVSIPTAAAAIAPAVAGGLAFSAGQAVESIFLSRTAVRGDASS